SAQDESKREIVTPGIDNEARSENQQYVHKRADSFNTADTGVAIRGENIADNVGDQRSLPPAIDQAETDASLPSQIREADLGALYATRDVTLTFAKEQEEVDP